MFTFQTALSIPLHRHLLQKLNFLNIKPQINTDIGVCKPCKVHQRNNEPQMDTDKWAKGFRVNSLVPLSELAERGRGEVVKNLLFQAKSAPHKGDAFFIQLSLRISR